MDQQKRRHQCQSCRLKLHHLLLALIVFTIFTFLRTIPVTTEMRIGGLQELRANHPPMSSPVPSLAQPSFQKPQKQFNSTLNFVVFLGLEGTGHHLMQLLVNESNTLQDLTRLDIHPTLTDRMYKLLFRSVKSKDPHMGLWSAPCRRALSGNWMENKEPNITRISDRLVNVLKLMEHKASSNWRGRRPIHGSSTNEDHQQSLTVPVNTIFNTPSSGLLSYPSFLGPCRPLTYPNLDVWYNICVEARVNCQHVYLHRNPYEIIKSTSGIKRHMNADSLDGIHLYSTLLQVLFSQLHKHGSRTLGCVDFFDNINSESDTRTTDVIGNHILDYGGRFQQHLESIFQPPEPFNWEKEKHEVVPPHIEPYMNSMMELHQRVVDLCRWQAAQQST